MPKRVAYSIILAEDQFHQNFIRGYLKKQWGNIFCDRKIRYEISPSGRGSGEQFVRTNYSKEVNECRRRNAKSSCQLIVMTDADSLSTDQRIEQLEKQLQNDDLSTRKDNEPIVVLVPKRHVETWIHALQGRSVDELTDYKHPKPTVLEIKQSAEKIYELTRANAEVPPNLPASLVASIPEWQKIP